jgi:tetratricopeptide (TPR) repeat protein
MSSSLNRALLLYEQSRHDLAEKELRQHLAQDPDDAFAHALLGLCLVARKEFAEATREAERAIGLAPDLAYAHYALAFVLYHRNRFKEAEAAIRQAIDCDPGQADYFSLLAAIRFDQSRWADALAAAEHGLALDPEHAGCTNLRAMALVKLGRRDEAGATIDDALRREPDNALTHANQGWTFLEKGDPQKALEHFREALRLEPNLDWARQGVLEALKARYRLYRLILMFFLWMSKLTGRAQWGVIIGLFVGYQVLRSVAQENPGLAPFLWPILIAYIVFAVLTWTASPLFNLLLRLNRFGRLVLSPEEIWTSNWVGGCVAAALAVLVCGLIAGDVLILVVALILGLLVVPVAGTCTAPAGRPRRLLACYTLALAFAGLAPALSYLLGDLLSNRELMRFANDNASTLTNLFIIGNWLFGVVANAVRQVRPRL